MGWMLKGVRDGSRRFVGSEAIRRELVEGTSRWATTGIVVDWADWDRLHRDAGLLPTKDEQPLGWEAWLRDRATSRSATSPASSTRPSCSATSGWPGSGPTSPTPGTELRLETTLHHSTTTVAVQTAPLPFFNPARKTARP